MIFVGGLLGTANAGRLQRDQGVQERGNQKLIEKLLLNSTDLVRILKFLWYCLCKIAILSRTLPWGAIS